MRFKNYEFDACAFIKCPNIAEALHLNAILIASENGFGKRENISKATQIDEKVTILKFNCTFLRNYFLVVRAPLIPLMDFSRVNYAKLNIN